MTKLYPQSFPGSKNAGFTLIELLVVVLIIGILAAVALPQYERAVGRSRMAEALATLRSLSQAAEAYALAAGEWPASYDVLSVVPSGKYNTDNDRVEGRYHTFVLIDGRIDAGALRREDYPSLLYVSDFASSMKAPVPGKHLYCYYLAKGTDVDGKMERMCKAMGGGEKHVVSGTSTWFALD